MESLSVYFTSSEESCLTYKKIESSIDAAPEDVADALLGVAVADERALAEAGGEADSGLTACGTFFHLPARGSCGGRSVEKGWCSLLSRHVFVATGGGATGQLKSTSEAGSTAALNDRRTARTARRVGRATDMIGITMRPQFRSVRFCVKIWKNYK